MLIFMQGTLMSAAAEETSIFEDVAGSAAKPRTEIDANGESDEEETIIFWINQFYVFALIYK